MEPKKAESISGVAHAVVDRNREIMEEGVDAAMQHTKEAIREVSHKAQDTIDQTVDRTVKRLEWSWEQQLQRIEEYLHAHPWIVLGGLMLAGYFIERMQRPKGMRQLRR